MPSRASSRHAPCLNHAGACFSRDPEGFDRPLHHHLIYLHFHQYIRINTMRKYLLSIPMILLLLVGSASAQTVNFSLRASTARHIALLTIAAKCSCLRLLDMADRPVKRRVRDSKHYGKSIKQIPMLRCSVSILGMVVSHRLRGFSRARRHYLSHASKCRVVMLRPSS